MEILLEPDIVRTMAIVYGAAEPIFHAWISEISTDGTESVWLRIDIPNEIYDESVAQIKSIGGSIVDERPRIFNPDTGKQIRVHFPV